ncbi:MAG: lytic transglycosylase domain-containing protein [Sphingomicrobium sp.]
MAALSLIVAAALASSGGSDAPSIARWHPLIAEASQRFGVSESIIASVIRAESGGRTTLNGRPITSRAGAMGLMQLMPGTWAALRSELQLGSDPYDPHDNIVAGTAYLRQLGDSFGYPGMIAAYNAGPGRYAAYFARRQRLPAETVAYLNTVTRQAGSTAITPLTQPRDLMFVLRRDLSTVNQSGAAPTQSNGLFAVQRPQP